MFSKRLCCAKFDFAPKCFKKCDNKGRFLEKSDILLRRKRITTSKLH